MAELALSEELVAKIRELAQKEQRSLDELVEDMLEQYESPLTDTEEKTEEEIPPKHNPLVGLIGLLDEYTNENDLSSTIRETLKQNTHPQYGWTKRGRTD